MDQQYIELIKETFPLDTTSTSKLNLSTIKPSTRVYKVDTASSPLIKEDLGDCYILDTSSAQKIASHPSIVGEEQAKLSLDTGQEFKKMAEELDLLTGSTGILHILRGSGGYMLDVVFNGLPLINVRTEYREDGYRSHSDDSRRIDVTYSDYTGASLDTLIVPDTYATGRSVEAAVLALKDAGLEPSHLVIYGFIAIPSIQRIHAMCHTMNCHLTTVALCDITQLAANNYDMTLFGPDEYLHKNTGELNLLGSIVGEETLRDMAESFIPGLDQPGDWSESQVNLFNGHGTENGDIKGHLSKSIEFIEELDRINRENIWYNEKIEALTRRELTLLHETSAKF